MTAIEYARRKGCSLDWVYRLLRLGFLPGQRVDGKWVIDDDADPLNHPTVKRAMKIIEDRLAAGDVDVATWILQTARNRRDDANTIGR